MCFGIELSITGLNWRLTWMSFRYPVTELNIKNNFTGTALSEPYICYYCQSAAAHTTSILDQTICYHANEKFTYRYYLLDETDGIMKYRSRHFNIPCSSLPREKKNNRNNICTRRIIGIVCASYLDSHRYTMVNTAIINLYHGLLSVRYVALYDRIERQWHICSEM